FALLLDCLPRHKRTQGPPSCQCHCLRKAVAHVETPEWLPGGFLYSVTPSQGSGGPAQTADSSPRFSAVAVVLHRLGQLPATGLPAHCSPATRADQGPGHGLPRRCPP